MQRRFVFVLNKTHSNSYGTLAVYAKNLREACGKFLQFCNA